MTLRDTRQLAPRHWSGQLPGVKSGTVREELWTCDMCDRPVVVAVLYLRDNNDVKEMARAMLWPRPVPRELGADVPKRIRDLYAEAARAEAAGAPRLAGAGYRATVEEICKDQGATKNNLHDKITELASKVGQDIVDALHEARLVGNFSLHDGLVFSVEEIQDIADLVREATVVLYDQPAQRKRMADARKQRRDAHKNGPAQATP